MLGLVFRGDRKLVQWGLVPNFRPKREVSRYAVFRYLVMDTFYRKKQKILADSGNLKKRNIPV